MTKQSCRNFQTCVFAVVLFTGCALASNHQSMNGVWQLVPERSEFNGEPAIQAGTVTINDREHNVYVSRNFTFDSPSESTTTSFSTDARHNASIKDKETGFKSKAKWDGDVLTVTTTQQGSSVMERYSLRDDRTLVLQLDRPGHQPETLYFERH